MLICCWTRARLATRATTISGSAVNASHAIDVNAAEWARVATKMVSSIASVTAPATVNIIAARVRCHHDNRFQNAICIEFLFHHLFCKAADLTWKPKKSKPAGNLIDGLMSSFFLRNNGLFVPKTDMTG